MLKPGMQVRTKEMIGTLIKSEGIGTNSSNRWLVNVTDFTNVHSVYRDGLIKLQEKQGGLYLFESEFLNAQN